MSSKKTTKNALKKWNLPQLIYHLKTFFFHLIILFYNQKNWNFSFKNLYWRVIGAILLRTVFSSKYKFSPRFDVSIDNSIFCCPTSIELNLPSNDKTVYYLKSTHFKLLDRIMRKYML